MSQRSKRELHGQVQSRYLKASKAENQRILDEFMANTGYHRKYAIRVLKHGYKCRLRKPKGRRAIYRGEVVEALGQICSKRLHPYLPEGIRVLERCGELQLAPGTKSLLLQISRWSIDRYLTPVCFPQPHGRSTTKPGSLLKKQIPIRTVADWTEDKAGFFLILMKRIVGIQNRLPIRQTLDLTDKSHVDCSFKPRNS